ncbi:MAG: protein translocase SEC61 complex subunit gamma [Methanophagales archaeon]|nr:protein translocase SEC61 complex subunit gamma [Methanophagales archaeon]
MELKYKERVKKLQEYTRILKLARRPNRDEFLTISKIAGAIVALVGFIGFTIYLLLTVLPMML